MDTDSTPPLWLLLAVAAANIAALADLPYGYYQVLRIVVCGVAIWTAVACHARSWTVAMTLFGLVAILYNPMFKIHLEREVHAVVNVIVALLFAATVLILRRPSVQ